MRLNICSAAFTCAGMLLASNAQAGLATTFFPVSDYNPNTTTMNTTLGLTGDTIDNLKPRL